MVDVQDAVIKDRQDEFIPDEISFLNFVVSDYDNPKVDPAESARLEYDNQTKHESQNLRTKVGKEADVLGLINIPNGEQAKGDFIRKKVEQY